MLNKNNIIHCILILLVVLSIASCSGNQDKGDTSMYIPAQFYAKKKDYAKAAQSYLYAGRVSLAQGNNEAAIVSLLYAKETKNDWYIGRMHRRLAGVHWDLKEYDKAKENTLISITYDKKGDDAIFNYSTLAKCYLQDGEIDSAFYYTEKMKETEHGDAPESLLIYHGLLSQVLEKKSNYPAALEEAKEVIKLQSSITKEKRNNPISYILEQHEKERIENEYNHVLIHRLRLVITVIVIILLGMLAGWFLMYRIKRKENELLEAKQTLNTFRDMLNQKNKQLQAFDHELSERDAQLSQQAELLLDYGRVLTEHNRKSGQLRSFLTDKLDVARKVAQMNVVTTNNTNEFMRQFQKVFGQNVMDWDNIYPVINDLYNGFVDKMKVAYPNLTEKELQLCCFIRSGFKSDEQAVLLEYTQSTIRVKRAQLVKRWDSTVRRIFFLT